MPEKTYANKIYKGPLFMDECRAVGVTAGLRVQTPPDGSSVTVTFDNAGDEPAVDSVEAAHDATILSDGERLTNAKQGLSDKTQLARDHAADIMPLFNTILDQTLNQTTQPARYDTIRAVVDGSAAGFRAAFHGDLLQEMGIDASAALTAAQQRQYCVYARVWVNQVGLLLSLA